MQAAPVLSPSVATGCLQTQASNRPRGFSASLSRLQSIAGNDAAEVTNDLASSSSAPLGSHLADAPRTGSALGQIDKAQSLARQPAVESAKRVHLYN